MTDRFVAVQAGTHAIVLDTTDELGYGFLSEFNTAKSYEALWNEDPTEVNGFKAGGSKSLYAEGKAALDVK